MFFKLKLNIVGLAAFVPNKDEKKSLSVLLIDGRAPGIASDGSNHVSHRPSLRFNLANLDTTSKQPPFDIIYDAQEQIYYGQWYFNGDDINIISDNDELSDSELQILRTSGDTDFSLIPSMKNIYPDLGGIEVKSSCLDENCNLKASGLVGRMKLKGGTLGAYSGKNGEGITSEEFTFTNSPNSFRQRLAAGASFETEIQADKVVLFSKQRQQSLTFKPVEGNCVEIFIENIPPKGIESAKPISRDIDIDFQLVYKIASPLPQQLRVPSRQSFGPEFPTPLLCGGVIYNPDERA